MTTAATPAGPVLSIQNLADAILHTVVYADLFDYPLTSQQIHRFLTAYTAPLDVVEESLAHDDRLCQRLGSIQPFWFLAGREHLVELRRQRDAFSQVLWRKARRYGALVAHAPFVRMVAITGSLSMNNAIVPDDDVDLLIVTAPGRLWLARGLVILVVHLARLQGLELCPNYLMSEHHLQLGEPSLFTAHELAQLTPLCGMATYHRLLQTNTWLSEYLPNFSPYQPPERKPGTVARGTQHLLEALLSGRLGDAVERWEQGRKIPQLRHTAEQRGGKSTEFSPDLCKGHVDDHGTAIGQLYASRLAANGL